MSMLSITETKITFRNDFYTIGITSKKKSLNGVALAL